MAEMKAALGPDCWLALNVGDGQTWEDWRLVRERAKAANVTVLPWARCHTLGECHDLMETADLFSSRVILNIEDEFKDVLPPSAVAALLTDYIYQSNALDVAISTPGWLYNDVDYHPLSELPVLLQLFAQDMRRDPSELEEIQAQCVVHARDKGFTYVGVTFQTYGAAEPSWYAYHKGTRSLYTGDDVGGGQWAPWSVAA